MGRAQISYSVRRLGHRGTASLSVVAAAALLGFVAGLEPQPVSAWEDERPTLTPTRIPALDGDEPRADSDASDQGSADPAPPAEPAKRAPAAVADEAGRNTAEPVAEEPDTQDPNIDVQGDGPTNDAAGETDSVEQAEPSPHADPLAAYEITDVQSSSFQTITPGQTELAELKAALGEPAERISVNGKTVLLYQVGPFPRVEFVIHGEQVSSILVRLKAPADVENIARDLGLQNFRPLPVRDESGKLLGEAYPERGVVLSYPSPQENADEAEAEPETQTVSARQVAHILLQPIGAEPFVGRAEAAGLHGLGQALADVRYALRLEPNHVHASWLEARILSHVGRYAKALTALERAIEKSTNDPEFRERQELQYLLALLLHQNGKHREALDLSQRLAVAEDASELLKARAELLWGNILSQGIERDYRQAINHHSAAIRLATPSRISDDPAVRKTATEILIEAHLAAATDVAQGNWQKKTEVIPKWLDAARKLTAELIEHDQGDEQLWLAVHHSALAASATLEGALDPYAEIEELLSRSERLLSAAVDPLDKHCLHWQLGQSVLMAARAEKALENYDQAQTLAARAQELLESSAVVREPTPARDYLLGQAAFLVGALQAVAESDHAEAVEWYDKALGLFPDPLPATYSVDVGRHGERLVGMGVSYWENGDRQQGIELTEHGTGLIEEAVEHRWLPQQALVLAYNNLATMQRDFGNVEQAEELTARAEKLRSIEDTSQRR